MHSAYSIPIWKASPFIRLLLPLFAGVIARRYVAADLKYILTGGLIAIGIYFFLLLFGLSKRYRLRNFQGISIQLIILFIGMLLTWNNDIRNDARWFAHRYSSADYLIVNIDEPLVKKAKSYKADVRVASVISAGRIREATGKLIAYFKDTSNLRYGDRILIQKPLQRIRNSGNPAAFDYVRYAAFRQQFHTVFLSTSEYVVLEGREISSFQAIVFKSRDYILHVLRTYVGNQPGIIGIAEALLIGYKHDLDKDLMQAYSNTGVVHIIAISGLHLGLIYVMLNWLMGVLPLIKSYTTVKVVLILSCLWLFSILTGSSASVLRSALMFTCVLIGKTYFKQSSTYNAIAASAFILVCYNPYFLWDVGFQLSYLAVIGIVWLQKPILHLLYIKNVWLHKVWTMVAVTLAAQVAAFPLCIYYFHQFPNLFLITNIIAVPLSTLVLFAEILLLCFSWFGIVAVHLGKLIAMMITLMNTIITYCNKLPWSVTSDMYATTLTTCILYGLVIYTGAWLIYRKKILLKILLMHISGFAILHLYADIVHGKQNKIIVYNIARHQAIDFISGKSFYFLGDSSIRKPGSQQNFHVKPARISLQARHELEVKNIYDSLSGIVRFRGKHVLVIDTAVVYKALTTKVEVELLVITRNPKLKIGGLLTALKPTHIVFDASNSLWKIEEWKKECSVLLLPFHSVPDQGAFVLDLNEP